MKEFFCKTVFLTVGAFFERPRANAVRPYERMGECESDSAAPEGRAEPDSMRGWRLQQTKKATLLGCFVRCVILTK